MRGCIRVLAQLPLQIFFFLEDMSKYKEFDAQVAAAAVKKLAKHRWYLQQETVVYYFSKYPSTINDGEKHDIV